MNVSRAMASAVCGFGLLAGIASAVNIETVRVGDPGNAADTPNHCGNPAGQGSVGYTYNIGKYEVTAGQYCEFLNKVGATDTYGLYNSYMANSLVGCGISRSGSPGSYTYSVTSAYVNRPVSLVSYWDACRFTNWLSNGQPTGTQGAGTTERGTYTLDGYNGKDGGTIQRNPGSTWAVTSEDEWYKAAHYKGGSTNAGYWSYPTRSNTAPGRDLNDASGNNANYDGGGHPIDPPYSTTLAGEFQNSASPYGTFDQCGNVCEFNEGLVAQGATYAWRSARGGSFNDSSYYIPSSYRGPLFPTDELSVVGFRVSQVPEPTSLALLAMAGVGMLVRRRGHGR